jgi:hypothetical protein
LQQGEPARCSVDPAHKRTLSLFQLGLRWFKRFLTTGMLVLPDFQACLSNPRFQSRRNGHSYRTSCEVEFGITSLTRKEASPAHLLCLRRAHWSIETGLHYRRDVTLREDATRMTVGNTGKVMASLNNLVLALIRQAGFHNAAQARRWFAAHLSQAFALLSLPVSGF